MPQIVPIKDLRKTNEISELCHSKKEPIFITKNGYGDLVLMSMETYEELIGVSLIDYAIDEAEKEYEASGEKIKARELFSKLKEKYFEKL